MADQSDRLTALILTLYRRVASYLDENPVDDSDDDAGACGDTAGIAISLRAIAVKLSCLLQDDDQLYGDDVPARVRAIEREIAMLIRRVRQQSKHNTPTW